MKLVTQATGALVTTWTRGRTRTGNSAIITQQFFQVLAHKAHVHLIHSCLQSWSGLWRTLTQCVDALMRAAVIRTVAHTYLRCWCTHARSRDPDCGVHLPKALMNSCSQPWSGLWRTLTQGVDALILAPVIRTVAYTYPRCWCTHARSRDPDYGTHHIPSWSLLQGSTQFDTVNSLCTWKGIVSVFAECLYFFLVHKERPVFKQLFLTSGFWLL